MGDAKLPVINREKDRELLIAVANDNDNDDDDVVSSKPCCSSSTQSSHHAGREVLIFSLLRFLFDLD